MVLLSQKFTMQISDERWAYVIYYDKNLPHAVEGGKN